MRRPPWFGRYLTLEVLGRLDDATVYRAHDTTRSRTVLLVALSSADPVPPAELLSRLTAATPTGSEPIRPVEAHLDQTPAWLVLPEQDLQPAVELIGLARPRQQGWLAVQWGWPHAYPETVRQLGVRCLTVVVVAALLAWGAFALRWLLG